MEENANPHLRGAQPGNTNALKHGFYSRRFSELELSDLEVALSGGLDNEIQMLRVACRRGFEAWEQAESLDEKMKCLSTLSIASTRLATLERTKRMLLGNEVSDFESAFNKAMSEVCDQLGIKSY